MFNIFLKACITTIMTFIMLSHDGCKSNGFDIKIERFEFLDEYTGENHKDESLNNRLLYKAFLIHDYSEKYEKEINEYVDRYVCDSLLPNIQFNHDLFIGFFKSSDNTNRENFLVRPKNKMIYARSNDYLFFYSLLKTKDSTIWISKQKIAGTGKLNPPREKLHCQ